MNLNFVNILIVFGSGGVGAVCRYLISYAMRDAMMGLDTWVINSVGCFLIGVFAGWLMNSDCNWSQPQRQGFTLATMTGFCGGFSTFSAFTLDCVKYIERDQFGTWAILGSMTVLVGLFGCALGYWLGKQL